MGFIKLLVIFLFVAMLQGCAGSPFRISMMSSEEIKAESTFNLCNAYAFSGSSKAEVELLRRNTIPGSEWLAIKKNKINIGMSEDSLACSWGRPERINTTVTRHGVRKQWVYSSCDRCKRRYVYTSNGSIVSWQN